MKIWQLIILFVSINAFGYAQSEKFVAGVMMNVNGIELQGQTDLLWKNVDGTVWGGLGSSFGIHVSKEFRKHYFVKFEIRYIQKGSVYEYVNEFASQKIDMFKLNYIETPLSFGLLFPQSKKIASLEAGLSVARMFSSKTQIDEITSRSYQPITALFKDFDYSVFALMQFPVFTKHTKNVQFGLRCAYSLGSIHDYYKLRHFVYGLQLEYRFG